MKLYHYIECGLDDVWLINGFEYHESPRGKTVSISNIESLHEAVGVHICRNRRDLSGAEIRFLRREMLMSQSTLARLLDVTELTINRWETEKSACVEGGGGIDKAPLHGSGKESSG